MYSIITLMYAMELHAFKHCDYYFCCTLFSVISEDDFCQYHVGEMQGVITPLKELQILKLVINQKCSKASSKNIETISQITEAKMFYLWVPFVHSPFVVFQSHCYIQYHISTVVKGWQTIVKPCHFLFY